MILPLLLFHVVSVIAGRYLPEALRQRAVQKQAGTLQGFTYVEQNAGEGNERQRCRQTVLMSGCCVRTGAHARTTLMVVKTGSLHHFILDIGLQAKLHCPVCNLNKTKLPASPAQTKL